jgi:hypothetical protein
VGGGQASAHAREAELGGELRGAFGVPTASAQAGECDMGFGFPGSRAQPPVHG